MATEVDLHLQQVKLQHIASARRAYNMSAGVLSEFGLLDDLCEMGKIPQETRDNVCLSKKPKSSSVLTIVRPSD